MASPPPPLSSSSSSTNSPSPSSEHPELKPDPSDPLDFLLQSISQHTDSDMQHSNPPDWSDLSAWTRMDGKYPDLASDFDFSLPMDLDFDPSMAVDPSALHFSSIFDQSSLSLPVSDNSFLDTMPNQLMYSESNRTQPAPTATERRMSIGSSVSSSGVSLSPFVDNASVISSSPPSDSCFSDPAQELAHRVRQIAGVTLAVPVSAHVQQIAAAGAQAKLPIPRLTRPSVSPASSKSGSPPASTSSSSASSEKAESPAAEMLAAPPTTTVIGRPKTSHTTIERRYRTNLNTRITGLKQAVPALRVLEAKNNGGQSPYNDVVDARGFVDGVKVARKMSKANVLGKATEYIRVLKKREARMKREQDGLKSLVSGLVGGPALLKEWEREWRERFGGEEKDEVEDDVAAASDDEEGDGEDSDGEDGEGGRARKKAKTVKAPKKEKPPRPPPAPVETTTASGVIPEKRKRGRPRKVPLPTPVASLSNVPLILAADQSSQDPLAHHTPPQQSSPQQYLLAAFAFFSVFNSPLTSLTRTYSTQDHAHHGTVLTPHAPAQSNVPTPSTAGFTGYGWHEVIQAVHLLVSTLVFFYVLLPWLSNVLSHTRLLSSLSSLSRPRSCPTPDVAAAAQQLKPDEQSRAVLTDALAPACRGSADEPAQLRAALGVSTGLVGLMQGVIKAGRADRGIELNQLEQRAWVRLGEIVAFDARVAKTTRLQTFWCMSWHISTFSASTTDLSTLALIIRPVSSARAAALWDRARKREYLSAHERLVLDSMSVDDAAEWLAKWQNWHASERRTRCAACEKRTPLGVLAAILIRERLRKHAAALFVRTVVPADLADDECAVDGDWTDGYAYNTEQDHRDEEELRETVEAGKSIGGRTAELAVLLERIWDTGFCAHEEVLSPQREHAHTHGRNNGEDADCEDAQDLASTDEWQIRALLSATIVYRRIFPSSFPACSTSLSFVLSPPPSPSRNNAVLTLALRTALASPAFEYGGGRLGDEELGAALEDARDRVNDMLVELERPGNRGGSRQC